MTDPVILSASKDLLLPHRVVLPVLGHPTSFESNSAAVIERAEQTFGGWQTVGTVLYDEGDLLRIQLALIDADEPGPRPPTIQHITPDATRLIVQSPGSIAVSDPAQREVTGHVTTALFSAHELFRVEFFEAATLALLSHFDRHPIHAAAVGLDGRAVLLFGASGTGKSTLAHLAHSAGLDALSEDHVWIQLDPNRRIWGWPGYARLLCGDGDRKSIVPLAGTDRRACYVADDATVCILARGARASLEPLEPLAVVDALTRDVAPGFDRFPERHALVANALAAQGGWRLTLSDNPRDALPLLDAMLSHRAEA